MSNGSLEFDLVINNGKLVIPPDVTSSSIGIKGEKIAAIAIDLTGVPAKKNRRQGQLRSSLIRKRTLAFTVLWKMILSRRPGPQSQKELGLGNDAHQSDH